MVTATKCFLQNRTGYWKCNIFNVITILYSQLRVRSQLTNHSTVRLPAAWYTV